MSKDNKVGGEAKGGEVGGEVDGETGGGTGGGEAREYSTSKSASAVLRGSGASRAVPVS